MPALSSAGSSSALGSGGRARRTWPRAPPGTPPSPVELGDDAVGLDLAIEGLGVDAEHGGRLGPMTAHAAEGRDDVQPLHVLETSPRRRARGPPAANLLRQVAGLDLIALREDHRPLHRVLQLAHVAGPVVALQALHPPGGEARASVRRVLLP